LEGDAEESRGWLVDGCSALLHLLRTSLELFKSDKFSSELLFDETKFQESQKQLQPDAALEVLLNQANRVLPLYPKEEKTEVEKRPLPDGRTVETPKTVVTTTTLQDRIEELYETLEKLIDHKAITEAAYKGMNAKPRIYDRLEGWDFAEIAQDRDPFYLKVAKMPFNTPKWLDFTRAIPAVTL